MEQDIEFQAKKVFVLGLPGSGKSTATRCMEVIARDHRWSSFRISDYDILYSMYKANRDGEQFSSTQHGGFDVHDLTVFDTALEELETQVRQESRLSTGEKRLVIIEFARANYIQALKNFTDDFLQDAHFLFIRADIPTCRQRICERVQTPQTTDDHYVSKYIFEIYYHMDDGRYTDALIARLAETRHLNLTVDIIDNPASQSLQDFYKLIEQYIFSVIDPTTIDGVQEVKASHTDEEHRLSQQYADIV